MTSMLVEAVVVAFCVGGSIGAIVAMQLQNPARKAAAVSNDHTRRQPH